MDKRAVQTSKRLSTRGTEHLACREPCARARCASAIDRRPPKMPKTTLFSLPTDDKMEELARDQQEAEELPTSKCCLCGETFKGYRLVA